MDKKANLTDWLTYIEQAHTKEIDMGLSRTKHLITRLQLNFAKQSVITVGGTNGKGTTCALIEQVCLHAGLTVGVYSSPHLLSFCERIRINGELIDEAALCHIFEQIDAARHTPPIKEESFSEPIPNNVALTYFEFATLAGLKAFSDNKVDVIILEVGLGGRLDAVNVVDADVSVITSIGLDHQDWLGDTKEKIAFEKAGIFRTNKPAIIGETMPQQSMLDYAEAISAKLVRSGHDYIYDEKADNVTVGGQEFSTRYAKIPKQNVGTALAAIAELGKKLTHQYPFLVPSSDVQSIINKTQVLGRHHVLRASAKDQHCAIILDVAHNEDSAKQLSRLIRTYPFNKCHIVVGMLKDKNIEASLRAFSGIDIAWYCASLPTSRGEQAERLVKAVNLEPENNAKVNRVTANTFCDVNSAYKQALNNAHCDDIILVMGSFLTVAAVLEYHASS